ncbi:hypothetical protein [Bacillus sp. KH172YL63]|uniref:hypothetical protein n=1 Tax=Bacillus sp. KH172YL63 TaxID=2709784 RepID=UPI0013E4B87A|nr:hypothetical protein [Bacillus sp. KH172YL63]BCB03932.1 hypothetical protein KH172YL63_20650 [Bacillus sp. KH172YL63]
MKPFPKVALLFACILLAGCSPAYEESRGFKESSLLRFPVPMDAESNTPPDTDHTHIDRVEKFSLANIGGEQALVFPEAYHQYLEKKGWIRQEDRQAGSVHFYQKGKKLVAIEMEEDAFTLYEWKEN